MTVEIPDDIRIGLNSDDPVVLRQTILDIQNWLNVIKDTDVWLKGTGAPAALLGDNGNFYFDKATGNTYYKEAGTWLP